MSSDIYSVQHRLDLIDLDLLFDIYTLRCLTVRQAYQTFYKPVGWEFNDFVDKRLVFFRIEGLLEEISFGRDNVALFLSKRGIDVVRAHFDIPEITLNDSKTGYIRGYYRPSELKMLPRLIPHQVHLNQFVLEFRAAYKANKLSAPWMYFDEKYVSQYRNIRPDGLIRIGGTDFFLELDMSTESKSQLIEKWQHYYSFLHSAEYQHSTQRITVLFILENTGHIEMRKQLVTQLAMERLKSVLNGQFDIFVGTREQLLKRVFNSLLPDIFSQNQAKQYLVQMLEQKEHFKVSPGKQLLKQLNYTEYEFYVRKLDSENRIVRSEGGLSEYICDYIYTDSLAFLQRMEHLEKNSAIFAHYYNRGIRYVLICEDLRAIQQLIESVQVYIPNDVYFTTLHRIQNYTFERALLQFDANMRLYRIREGTVRERVYLDEEH